MMYNENFDTNVVCYKISDNDGLIVTWWDI